MRRQREDKAGEPGRLIRVLFGAIAMAALASAASALPAFATSPVGDVHVSPDGVTYYSNYSGPLFTNIGLMVPKSTQTQPLYIRNDGSQPGLLRIVMRDVVYSDATYAGALSLQLSTPGHTGPAVPITWAAPCWVLIQGQTVAPGQVVVINMAVALGDLNGQAGQNTSAQMSIGVQLSDSSIGSLPPTSCGGSTVVIPVTPRVGSTPKPTPSPTSTPPESQLPVESTGAGASLIQPNTTRRYDEYAVFVPLGAFVVGSGAFFMMAARRRARGEDDWSHANE